MARGVAVALVFASGTANAQDWGVDDDEGSDDSYTFKADEGARSDSRSRRSSRSSSGGNSGGDLGFGLGQTLLGTVGAEVEYYYSSDILITGHLGFEYFSPDAEGADSGLVVALAGGVFYRLAGDARTSLYGGARLDIASATDGATSEDGSVTQPALELPMRVQLRVNRSLALHFEGGLALSLVPEGGAAIGPDEPDAWLVALGGQLFGAGGVTVYLD
jgi:hypothetical protein